jgi:hypothetical protein
MQQSADWPDVVPTTARFRGQVRLGPNVGGMANAAVCPRCHEVVEREDSGKGRGVDERTDPWVFVAHDRDDLRGDTVYRKSCPGSGKNPWVAANSM